MRPLEKYDIEETKLIADIPHITCREACDRCAELWKLIPVDCDLNPIGLYNAMVNTFGKPQLEECGYVKFFKVPLG